jgi:HAE1 family hydrophobic/amphiphilic exporter-1
MTAVRRLITTLMMLLAAAALIAQEAPVPRTTEAVAAETDRDANDPRALHLSLDEALGIAMKQNLGVQIQNYETRISGYNLRSSYGVFDFFSDGRVDLSSANSPTTSTTQTSADRTLLANAGVTQLLPTGGTYSFGFNNSRTSAVGGFTNINPAYKSSLDFNFTQPLLKDFGVDITKRNITIAHNNLGITQGQFRTVIMDTVSAVEQAYLDLAYARRNVDVVKEALFLARDQARITQIRIDVGASAPLDILQPNVQIATTEESLVTAVASVRDAEDRLRQLLNLPRSEWDRPIVPTGDIQYSALPVDMDRAVEQALANRPEVDQDRLRTDTARVNALYTKNQTLPTVDFNLGYGVAGVAGKTLDTRTNPPTVISSSGYDRSLSQIFGRDFPSWNVGFTLGYPLMNITARANARAAELDLEQSQTFEAQTRQNITVEVRNAARLIETFGRTIAASRAARDAAEKNVEAERKRYENGMTTNFQVLEVQKQLSDARVRELFALVGYNKAVAAYHRAIGDILEVHHITVEQPEVPAEPDWKTTFFDKYNWLNYGHRVKTEEQPK